MVFGCNINTARHFKKLIATYYFNFNHKAAISRFYQLESVGRYCACLETKLLALLLHNNPST
jgi:hypothetical protein